MSHADLIRRLRELHAEVQNWSEYPDYDLDVVGLSADALEAAEARIRDLERVLAIGGADAYAEQFARAEAAEAEVARLRAALEAAHDHMHRLCAIIPGNDEAYKINTDLMASIREALEAKP